MATPTVGKVVEQLASLSIAGGKAKHSQSGKRCESFLFNLTHDSVIPFLSVYPREIKSWVHTRTCTWIFAVVLIHNFPKLETASTSFTFKWVNKLESVHTMEDCSTVRRSGQPTHSAAWMSYRCTVPREGASLKNLSAVLYGSTWEGKQTCRIETDQ